ncbi:MAG TPA: enoyl-CoA hydratase-related protein, partial [Acidimicrobiales bacterium]|nr:enoyl-CoA hydratase-related protein [Acidimicrobiales bacterium]
MELETGTTDLLARVVDRVAVFTLNRPERRNAFSPEMLGALARLLEHVEGDDGVGAILLTGSGGAFCAGGDVKGFAAGTATPAGTLPASFDRGVASQRLNQRATAGKLYSIPKPTLAALPGATAGAGLALALACDMRIAARGAVLTTAFAKVGFSGDYGGTWFLSRLVGLGKAKELYYLSERIEADEAERLGIVNWMVEPEDLEKASMELAVRLANGPSVAYRYMKENLNRAVDGPL